MPQRQRGYVRPQFHFVAKEKKRSFAKTKPSSNFTSCIPFLNQQSNAIWMATSNVAPHVVCVCHIQWIFENDSSKRNTEQLMMCHGGADTDDCCGGNVQRMWHWWCAACCCCQPANQKDEVALRQRNGLHLKRDLKQHNVLRVLCFANYIYMLLLLFLLFWYSFPSMRNQKPNESMLVNRLKWKTNWGKKKQNFCNVVNNYDKDDDGEGCVLLMPTKCWSWMNVAGVDDDGAAADVFLMVGRFVAVVQSDFRRIADNRCKFISFIWIPFSFAFCGYTKEMPNIFSQFFSYSPSNSNSKCYSEQRFFKMDLMDFHDVNRVLSRGSVVQNDKNFIWLSVIMQTLVTCCWWLS